MKATQLIAGNNKILNNKDKVFPLLKKIEMKNWICLYEKNNYDDADYLYQTLQKSSKGYGLIIEEPEWVEMDNHSKYKEWLETVEDYMNKKKNYKFAVFLLDKNDNIYSKLKKHSLCTNGYISQVIKVKSLKKMQ